MAGHWYKTLVTSQTSGPQKVQGAARKALPQELRPSLSSHQTLSGPHTQRPQSHSHGRLQLPHVPANPGSPCTQVHIIQLTTGSTQGPGPSCRLRVGLTTRAPPSKLGCCRNCRDQGQEASTELRDAHVASLPAPLWPTQPGNHWTPSPVTRGRGQVAAWVEEPRGNRNFGGACRGTVSSLESGGW